MPRVLALFRLKATPLWEHIGDFQELNIAEGALITSNKVDWLLPNSATAWELVDIFWQLWDAASTADPADQRVLAVGKSWCSCICHKRKLLVVMCCGNGESGSWSDLTSEVEPWLWTGL